MARFYGLPSIHLTGFPLRPIASFNNTSTYGLAKWMSKALKPATSSKTSVKPDTDWVMQWCNVTQFVQTMCVYTPSCAH